MKIEEKQLLFEKKQLQADSDGILPILNNKNVRNLNGSLFEEGARTNSFIFNKEVTSFLGAQSYLGAGGYVKSAFIGRYCSIGHRVTLGAGYHDTTGLSTHPSICRTKEILTFVGNDVWIGDGAVILPGVVIGTGAIIGANSVVTKDVESYSVVGGAPAKLIKYRFEKSVAQKVLLSKWWEYDSSFLSTLKTLPLLEQIEKVNEKQSSYFQFKTCKYQD